MINVYSDKHLAGVIFESDQDKNIYCFRYAEDQGELVPDTCATSLCMPIRRSDYLSKHKELHPVFEMNLPEGYLAQQLRTRFSKAVEGFNELRMLEIVGQHQIGRLSFGKKGVMDGDIPTIDLADILAHDGAESLFNTLVNQYIQYSGVSGAMPKVLVKDPQAHMGVLDKVAHRGTTHIVKAWDNDFPCLAENEYFCMTAAQMSGLAVPQFSLSKNGQFFVIERFDLKEGQYLGFEDFCALNGLSSREKYSSSYERLATRIGQFVSPETKQSALESYFKTLVLSCLVGNGDAHLKNFGVLYADPTARVDLCPTYDIVTTMAYITEDSMALTLNGSKRWPSRQALEKFGIEHCALSALAIQTIFSSVFEGLKGAAELLASHALENPDFLPVGQSMLCVWSKQAHHYCSSSVDNLASDSLESLARSLAPGDPFAPA